MREITPDPGGHRFIGKALGEAGNELAEELFGCSARLLDVPDVDGWTIRLIAAHVHAFEAMTAHYLSLMVNRRNPDLPVIDTEIMRDDPDACTDDPDHETLEYHQLRRRVQYILWDLNDRDWERTGQHPYRGELSVVQLARELHLHDLEYLWRVRRIKATAPKAGRAR